LNVDADIDPLDNMITTDFSIVWIAPNPGVIENQKLDGRFIDSNKITYDFQSSKQWQDSFAKHLTIKLDFYNVVLGANANKLYNDLDFQMSKNLNEAFPMNQQNADRFSISLIELWQAFQELKADGKADINTNYTVKCL
jgi:hypothetical protein